MHKLFIFLCSFLFHFTLNAQNSSVYNLDFEKKGVNLPLPLNWSYLGIKHICTIDSSIVTKGKYSISIQSLTNKADINDAAFVVNRIQAKPFLGSELKLTGSLRTAESKRGFAQLYMLVLKNGLTIQSVYSWDQRISGTTNWKENSISLKIDSSADQVVLGLMFRGRGQAWFDNLQLYLNGIALDEDKLYPAELSSAEQNWLNSHIIPLPKMVSMTESQPAWEKYLGETQIIGFGEFTHSTSEVFTAKSAVIKYLISKDQLKIIAWESGFAEAEIFNKCLQTKGCDVKTSFNKMISQPWNNEEVFELLQWIQNYNSTAEKPVQFVGFDMQRNSAAFNRLMHFAKAKNNKLLIKRLQKYHEADKQNFKVNPNYRITNVKIAKALKKEANEISKAFSNINDSAWIKQYAELLYQSGITWATDYPAANDLRDSFMAQNIIYIQAQNSGEKMVIWAHNAHISNRKTWMGSYLKKMYGDNYKIVGFSSRKGNYGSFKKTARQLVEPDQRCYEYFFPKHDFLLPLIDAQKSKSEETNWLRTEMLFRNTPWLSDVQFDPAILAEEFDFIYHIDETSASLDY